MNRLAAAEEDVCAHLHEIFDQLGVDLVIDVGARQGEYGQLLRRSGYLGPIQSFEPVSVNFSRLRELVDADPAWEAHQMALGSASSTAEINVSPITHFSSFRPFSALGKQRFPAAADIEAVEHVAVHRLDDLWSSVGGDEARAVFLKVDTQGWDLDVLRGAADHLHHVAGLQTELSLQAVYEEAPTMHESLAALSAWGFDPTGFFPVAVHGDGRLIEMDCVAIRRP